MPRQQANLIMFCCSISPSNVSRPLAPREPEGAAAKASKSAAVIELLIALAAAQHVLYEGLREPEGAAAKASKSAAVVNLLIALAAAQHVLYEGLREPEGAAAKASKSAAVVNLLQALGNTGCGVLRLPKSAA